MTINYSSTGEVKFSMVKYIGNMPENIPEEIKGESATPSGHHIFNTSEDLIKLFKSNEDIFHHIVAQLLYLYK